MWTIRLLLLAGLAAMTLLDFYMLRHRHERKGLIENWVFNSLLVAAYFSCCCLVAALPPAGGWDRRPFGWRPPGVRVGFVVAGSALLCLGLVLSLVSLRQRKALGLQDSQARLLTSGVYRHFRHPIYAGILWTCLGLSLLTRNPDGLLMFPALLALFIVQALIEEKYDMRVRFHDPYREYRRRTRMFGPAWLWSLLLVTVLFLALYSIWTGPFGLAGLRSRLAAGRIRTEGVTSYYVYSGTKAGHTGKLPAIIFIGHPVVSLLEDLFTYKDRFDEPVLLISSGVIYDLPHDLRVDDEATWARKRPLFLKLLDDYVKKLPIDKDRVYLTGYSAAGVYAWMLAYDHPELYAAVVPMSATCNPRQIQERMDAARAVVTVVVCGEKDRTMPQDFAGESQIGKTIEAGHPGSRFLLKPGEGHHDMHKYWRENLQYVLQFRRKDNQKMTSSRASTAASCREAFLRWARRAALPLPASPEEPLSERTQAALDRMLAGKRFAFLGEPEHFIVEKYPFRLLFIRHLLERGWRHVGMETGRSVGWRVDRYLETGDTSCLLFTEEPESPGPTDRAVQFIEAHEPAFHEQLRQVSERRAPGTARLRYWGYDLDLGVPLGAVKPIQGLLEGHAGRPVNVLRSALARLPDLSTDEQLAQIATLQTTLTAEANLWAEGTLAELHSWLAFLHNSVAAEKRPRANQDPRGHRRWWATQREPFLMQSLDAIVDGLGGNEKLILMGHNFHLSKEAAHLHLHPRFSRFWGLWSWLRAVGYRVFFHLAGWPTSIGDSVGAHLHRRFPGQVLSIWMVYSQGSLMAAQGPQTVRPHGDTVESLLAQVGDRFLLPLNDIDPEARTILSHANVFMGGAYASTDLTAQADALYFVKEVRADIP